MRPQKPEEKPPKTCNVLEVRYLGTLGPIVKQKFWLEKQLEKALEKQLEKRFEISYTGKRQKINSLHMSQNQKGI